MCSNPELLKQEKEDLRKALTQCKYPKWALDKVEKRLNRSSSEVIDGVSNQGTTGTPAATQEVKSKGHIVTPYTQGLLKVSKRFVVVTKSDAIYWYQCGDLGCDDEFIGETYRTFGERYKEHLKDHSPIHHHKNQTNHPINHNNFNIIGSEGHHLSRYIKESIFIRVNNPTSNNNVGKFNLPHIWDRVLINTPGLK